MNNPTVKNIRLFRENIFDLVPKSSIEIENGVYSFCQSCQKNIITDIDDDLREILTSDQICSCGQEG